MADGGSSPGSDRRRPRPDAGRQRLRQLRVASLALAAQREVPALLDQLAARARELLRARRIWVVLGLAGGAQRIATSPGPAQIEPAIVRLTRALPPLLSTAASLRLTRAEPRGAQLSALIDAVGSDLLVARLEERSGEPAGLILAPAAQDLELSAEDEELLAQLAVVASLTLQLIAAQDRIDESERRKGEFVAVLSHELRNPLAPIRNCLHLLRRLPPGEEPSRRALQIMSRQVEHMIHLLDGLLDVNRLGRGKIELALQPVELADLVSRAVEDHRPLFVAAGVDLQLCLPARRFWVAGDPNRLLQVLGNLLQNAARFTPAGGRTEVRMFGDPPCAVLAVRDTGVGISAELLPRIFEPFTQNQSWLERRHGGLGLGLALVRGLVELHGGMVVARSAGPGQGSELEVRLPLAEISVETEVQQAVTAGAPARRILIIDDNLDAAESLRDLLALSGHQVEVAHSGEEGLLKARHFRPEVVFCDIGLPGMNGFEVGSALSSDPTLRPLLLVALSGYARPEDLAASRGAGFGRHLAKPPDPDELQRLLAGLPGRPRRPRARRRTGELT